MINKLCYLIIIRAPHQFMLTKIGKVILSRAGEYAFSDDKEQS